MLNPRSGDRLFNEPVTAGYRKPSGGKLDSEVIRGEGGEIDGGIPAGFVAQEDAVLSDVIERAARQNAFVDEGKSRFRARGARLGKADDEFVRPGEASAIEFELAALGIRYLEDLEVRIQLELDGTGAGRGGQRDSGLRVEEAALRLEAHVDFVALRLCFLRLRGCGRRLL